MKQRTRDLALVSFVISTALASTGRAAESTAIDAEGCVRVALRESAQLAQAEALVRQYEARLALVESSFYPKLLGTTYLAPMFTVHGTALTQDVARQWKRPSDWGPYAHLEALLAIPLYSFGRAEQGALAARERAAVERARARQAENVVALEVRKLYHLRLYPLSLLPALHSAAEMVAEAEARGQELYEQATGDVTQADLMKLRYAATEVAKFERMATDGAALATSALKHTMGLADNEDVTFANEELPEMGEPSSPDSDLPALLAEAARQRPEWEQLGHGDKAAAALIKSEAATSWPIVFLAGQLTADWTPQRDDGKNPYWFDPYNQVFGGVALGLRFDVDPAKTSALVEGAEATRDEVDALRRFASTGIPLQVRKAQLDLEQQRALVELSTEGVKATRKWMAFAGAAYKTGTGEARDVLEGLVAYLQAKRGYYDALLAYHVSRAELAYAIGRAAQPTP